jgi:hypothetical protein
MSQQFLKKGSLFSLILLLLASGDASRASNTVHFKSGGDYEKAVTIVHADLDTAYSNKTDRWRFYKSVRALIFGYYLFFRITSFRNDIMSN